MRTNQTQRDTVAKLIEQDGESYGVSFEALMSAADAKLISFNADGSVVILDAGRGVVATDRTKKAARREKANARARNSTAAMRSIGMTRTPYGWE